MKCLAITSHIDSDSLAAMETTMTTNAADRFSEHVRSSIIVPGNKIISLSSSQLEHQIQLLQRILTNTSDYTQQRIAVALPNSIELVGIFFAVTRKRGIAALLNPSNKEHEFGFYLDDVDPKMVIVSKGKYDANSNCVRAAKKHGSGIAECYWNGQDVALDIMVQAESANGEHSMVSDIEPFENNVALILHTSGTTGRPKAKTFHGYSLGEDDRTMLLTPLFHVAGLLACLATLRSRGAVILPPRYSPSTFWQDLTEHNVTWYTTTPTMHRLILRLPTPKVMPPRLRFIRCSSSPLPPALFHELESRFQIPVVDSYGLTETSSFCTTNPLPPRPRLPGSVGIPQGVEIFIRNEDGAPLDAGVEGEICMRGENIVKGYLNDPDANARVFTQDGFFRTGDFGYLDANGYLFITARIREFINKGGEKISPVELDNVVTQHPAVAEAATFAVPDDVYGQDVSIAVTLRQGEQVERSKLKRWIRERVSAHKVPAKVFIVQELPKTATGKTQRQLLSQQVADGKLAVPA